MTGTATGWHRLHPLSPVVRSGRTAVGVLALIGITAAAGLGQGGSHLYDGIIAALKADTLSLTAFEIGLFGWMAIMQLVLFPGPHLKPDHAAYWFLMQIGMILGFASAFPVNVWLIRRGIKEAM